MIGQIGLVRTTGLMSWLIRVVTRSHWNHVVIAVSETECVGAEPHGAKLRPVTYFDDVVWSEFPLTAKQQQKITAWTRGKIGAAYGYFDDLAIGIGLLTRTHTPRWIEHWLSSNNQWECAALADAALQHGGVHVFRDDRPYGAVFPGSFVHVFEDYGWLKPDGTK